MKVTFAVNQQTRRIKEYE